MFYVQQLTFHGQFTHGTYEYDPRKSLGWKVWRQRILAIHPISQDQESWSLNQLKEHFGVGDTLRYT